MSERAEFVATLNTRQVDAELDKTRGRVHTLDGGLTSLKGGLDRLDNAASKTVQKGLGSLNFALGKSAGQAAGVVDGIGDIAGALASGGALGLALAGTTALVFKLQQAWEDELAAQEAAMRAQFASADKMIDENRALDVRIRQLREELGLIDRVAETKQQIADTQAELDGRVRERSFGPNAHTRTLEEKQAEIFLQDRIEKLTKILNLEMGAQTRGRGGSGGSKGSGGAKSQAEDLDADVATLAFAAKLKEDALKEYLANKKNAQDEEARLAQEHADHLLEIEKERLEQQKQLAQAELEVRTRVSEQALGIGVGAAQQLLAAIINGEQEAIGHIAASVAEQAGTAVIGHGINAAAGGLAMLSLGNPAGGAALGTGAMLIGAGLSIGGVGTGIEAMLGAGGGARAPSERARVEAGVNRGGGAGAGRRPAGSTKSGGATEVHFHYAAAGPSPTDTGRAVADALDTNYRRTRQMPGGRQGPRR